MKYIYITIFDIINILNEVDLKEIIIHTMSSLFVMYIFLNYYWHKYRFYPARRLPMTVFKSWCVTAAFDFIYIVFIRPYLTIFRADDIYISDWLSSYRFDLIRITMIILYLWWLNHFYPKYTYTYSIKYDLFNHEQLTENKPFRKDIVDNKKAENNTSKKNLQLKILNILYWFFVLFFSCSIIFLILLIYILSK